MKIQVCLPPASNGLPAGRFRSLATFLQVGALAVILLLSAVACGDAANSNESAWHIASPRIACLGDSILASSFVQYYPQSVSGNGTALTITLPSAGHTLKAGSKIKLIAFNKELCSEIFTVDSLSGERVTVKSSFFGTAKGQFYCKPACVTFELGQGYVAQALKRTVGGAPLFSATIPAAAVGSVAHDAVVRMDYELMPFASDFDIVIIQLGTNDLSTGKFTVDYYMGNMEKIIKKLHGAGKMVIIGNVPPVLSSAADANAFLARIKAANKALNDLGKRYNIPVLDFYSALAGPDGFAKKEYMYEARHPNGKGYAVMGNVLFEHAKKYFVR